METPPNTHVAHENKENQQDTNLDALFDALNTLISKVESQDPPLPPTGADVAAVDLEAAMLVDAGDEDAVLRAVMLETLDKYGDALSGYSNGFAPSPAKPRKKRRVGGLHEPRDITRELAAIYKEAYHGIIPWNTLTRATYTLDCLARSMQVDAGKRKKT